MDYTKVNNTYFAVAKADPKDKIEVEVGDALQTAAFFPQVKIKRWDNECNVSYRLIDDDPSVATVVKDDTNKIIWDKTKIAVNFYDLTDGEGGYEFELILKSKPKTNVIQFTLQDKDVDYFYQPELTAEEIAQGSVRPENVVGSYAVYAKTPKTNWTGGKEYKCGKVGHIFRPKIIDAVGDWVWGDLHIENGILSVTIPQEFLNKGIYPIRHAAGLTFGFTGDGVSTVFSSDGEMNGSLFAATAGTIEKISMRGGYFSNQPYSKAIIVNTSLAIITNGITPASAQWTNGSASPEWKDIVYTTSPTVSATNYWLTVIGSATYLAIMKDTGDANTALYKINNYTTPTDPTGAGTAGNSKYSIYATYTAAAGPANLKSLNTNLKANIKTINTNAIANVKSLDTNV